jgi:DNA-binding GntR family transcriptional regulator
MKKARSPRSSNTTAFEKKSMQQNTFLLLKTMIDEGRLRPGEKLLEVQVAKAFGISRSPARHALRALCDARIVREAAGRGYHVAGRPNEADVGQIASLEGWRIQSTPQWERIYKKLEEELCIRTLLGSVKIGEAALAEHFGVSRTVARDVLARMHGLGLVTKNGVGRWMARQISSSTIGELFELRSILEPEALLRAAPLAGTEYFDRMSEHLEIAIAANSIEMEAVGRLEAELHIEFLDRCPNQEIAKALAKTHLLFVPSLYLLSSTLDVPQQSTIDALVEHLEVVRQLRSRRPRKAALLLRDHLRAALERWTKRFDALDRTKLSALPPYLLSLD